MMDVSPYEGAFQRIVWELRPYLRYARNTLGLALGGALQRELPDVAQMLREREPSFTDEAAQVDIRGYLTDLIEILSGHAG